MSLAQRIAQEFNTVRSEFGAAEQAAYDNGLTDIRGAVDVSSATNVQMALDALGQESKWWSNINSCVRLFGGIIKDNGDGTVNVGSGGGLYKVEAGSVEGVPAGECEPMQLNTAQGGKLFYSTWDYSPNVPLTDNAYNYIFITWDHTVDNDPSAGDTWYPGRFGKTVIVANTNFYMNNWEEDPNYVIFRNWHNTKAEFIATPGFVPIPGRRSAMLHAHTVGRVYKMGNEITIRVCGTNGWNFNKRVQLFGEEFFPVIRARGLDIEPISGTNQFNVSEGVMWAEMANRFTVQAFMMENGDKFTSWYQHTAITTADTLAIINSTYPSGIVDAPYEVLYSSSDDKYYRWNGVDAWSEVLDYMKSKVNTSSTYTNLAALESAQASGYINNSEGTDYVLLQLQATDALYRYVPGNASGSRWVLYTGSKDGYVIVSYIGDTVGMNTEYDLGYNKVINVIVPTLDGMYYEYSGVIGDSGWKRVHGFVETNGWARFYAQDGIDTFRYNDTAANSLKDLSIGEYGVAWIYMVHDNSCHVIYGQQSYPNVEAAKNAYLPAPMPGLLDAYATLVGKVTFTTGNTTFEDAESPFLEKFVSSGVTAHNDLAGLDGGSAANNEFYHLLESEWIFLRNLMTTTGASFLQYSNTINSVTVTDVKAALDALTLQLAKNTAVTGTESKVRYDKILSNLDVIAMDYSSGKLDYVAYENDNGTSLFYRDVLTYNETTGVLENVKHYYGTIDLVTASGITTLSYTNGKLTSTTYVE